MPNKIAAALLTLCLLLLPAACFAAEFINPTRDPGAPPYNEAEPGALVESQLVARSAVLINRATGEILFEKNAHERMYPAAAVQVMTALLAVRHGEPGDLVTVSAAALNLPKDASIVPLEAGETLPLEDVLYGLLLGSGCDAANAIAEHVSGDLPAFVTRMNDAARSLGCVDTRFANPSGLHDEEQYTTAYDLARLLDAALKYETLAGILLSDTHELPYSPAHGSRSLTTANLHILADDELGRYDPLSLGGKTGYTVEAGYVLVEAAERDGVSLAAAVLYSGKYSRWVDVERLFAYGFSQASSHSMGEK